MSQAMVALVSKTALGPTDQGFAAGVSSWGVIDKLCPGEPFADQPAAAFCTGVLVDWDLVLTAGHCVRAFPLDDVAVVFDYFYRAPGQLAVDPNDLVDVVEIVSEALDPEGVEQRLDFAWVRLRAPVDAQRRPVALFAQKPPGLALGDPIVSIGAGGGIPIKLDAGATLHDLRQPWSDYFIADTDTSHGSSGAGAFTSSLVLIGILARGGVDFLDRGDGCRFTNHADPGHAMEQFTYTHQAVRKLCQKDPTASTICRAQCGEPCQALSRPVLEASGGCSLSGSGLPSEPPFVWVLIATLGTAVRTALSEFRRFRRRLECRTHIRRNTIARKLRAMLRSDELQNSTAYERLMPRVDGRSDTIEFGPWRGSVSNSTTEAPTVTPPST
jgi:hypothetical protein